MSSAIMIANSMFDLIMQFESQSNKMTSQLIQTGYFSVDHIIWISKYVLDYNRDD